MKNNQYIISQQELDEIGITAEEIEEAGGIEAIMHIIWFFQQPDTYSDAEIENAIAQAIEKRKQEEIIQKAFADFDTDSDKKSDDDAHTQVQDNDKKFKLQTSYLQLNPVFGDKTLTVKDIYEKNWGDNPHPALQLLVEAYFLETYHIVPLESDKKEILKTISFLRAYIAGKDLPDDAEDEHLIVYARQMYKEFLETKEEYHHCPILFLLDEYYDDLPEKYRMIAQSLPVPAILRIFADNCYYDAETKIIDEPLPEEVNIKNLCDMIERLARIYKIWQ